MFHQQYEYKVFNISKVAGPEQVLNNYFADWKLISVDNGLAYFRRRKSIFLTNWPKELAGKFYKRNEAGELEVV